MDPAGMLQRLPMARIAELVTPETSSAENARRRPLFSPMPRGKGYYRSAYAPAQYADLVTHAESALTPSERISLLGDEWAQVRADKATVGDYLNLVAALKSDPSAEVFSIAAGRIETITDKVALTKEERDELALGFNATLLPHTPNSVLPRPAIRPTRLSCARNCSHCWSIMATIPISRSKREKSPINSLTIPQPSTRRWGRPHLKPQPKTATPHSSISCKGSTRPRPIPNCRKPLCACLSSSTIPSCSSAVSNIRSRARFATRTPRFSSRSVSKSRYSRCDLEIHQNALESSAGGADHRPGLVSGGRCRQLLHRRGARRCEELLRLASCACIRRGAEART